MLESDPRLLRPANFGEVGIPGKGLTYAEARDGTTVAVRDLQGQLFLQTPVHPFRVVDALVEEARAQTPVVLVDFHAEATSEKIALARMLDEARHRRDRDAHPCADERRRVLPRGTAAITDAGMTGPHDSVIGVRAELAIQRMRTGIPVRFHPADGDVRIEGLLVECGPDGARAASRCACPCRSDGEHDRQSDEDVADEDDSRPAAGRPCPSSESGTRGASR